MNNCIDKLKFELELRTYFPSTIKHYICQVKLLEKHFNKSCDLITSDEIKEYLHFRISSGISYSNIDISCNAFKIMFNTVLNRNWSDNVIVRPKKQQKLPCVLSKQEILSIISKVSNLKHKTILLTIYSSGLRISEALNLKISDIDSNNMRIKVNSGKGNSDARIIEYDDDTVSFRYKDYKDKNRSKVMKLDKKEFVRRFLLHILPTGLTKIGHYGLLASRNLKGALLKISKLCKLKPIFFKPKEIIKICPVCGHKINLLFASTHKLTLESS